MLTIPKTMIHIWLGEKTPPVKWMDSWKLFHPEWNYWVFTDSHLSQFTFKNIDTINWYLGRKNYPGAADIIRYELLYQLGGFIPPADSVCLQNTDEIFEKVNENQNVAYVVYENELIRPDMFCPVYASTPNHPFLKVLIDEIPMIPESRLNVAYTSVGNLLVSKHLYNKGQDVIKLPSHYFVPDHFLGYRYKGIGKIYARQMWGSTKGIYDEGK